MTFNNKLSLLMAKKKIENLRRLSIESGIPYTTLRSCTESINGIEKSRLSTIKGLANYFKCSIDYLIYDNCDENEKIQDEISKSLLEKFQELSESNQETIIKLIDSLIEINKS